MSTAIDFYRLDYQPTPPLLRGTVPHPLTDAEYAGVCELQLAEALHYRCPWWLLDGRADGPPRPAQLYEWLQDDLLPRAHRGLVQQPTVAFMASAAFWQELKARRLVPNLVFSGSFRSGWFTDEAPALAWLARCRAGSPPPPAWPPT